MITMTKGEILRAMVNTLGQVCEDHVVSPFDVLHGGRKKTPAIAEARREFCAILRRHYCQWTDGGIIKYGMIEAPDDWGRPDVIPISSVFLGKSLGLNHATILQMNKKTADLAERERANAQA